MKKSFLIGLMAAFVMSIAFGSIAYAQTVGLNTGLAAEDGSCILNMVEKRESTILLAHQMFANSTEASMNARKAALLAAWSLTDPKERRTARTAAWNTYKKEQKAARSIQLVSVKLAWSQYKADAKVCNTDVRNVEPEGVDITVATAASASANKQ